MKKKILTIGLGLAITLTGGLFSTSAFAASNTYTVQRGDTPSSISQKTGVSVRNLIKANPSVHRLYSGERINVPISVTTSNTTATSYVTPATTHQASSSSLAQRIIASGKKYMGVPYQFGATKGNTSSFDCSSFTWEVFHENGINLPRSSSQQAQVGVPISRDQLQAGDLVFFYNPIHHVGIYIGNGQILHTYGQGGVTISNLNSGWWSSHFTTARRIL